MSCTCELHGEKLRGQFVIVRTRTDDSGKEQWLLLHKHDEHAVDGWDAEDHPQSVLTGRTNDEVKADPDRLWRSDLPAAHAAIALTAAATEPVSPDDLQALDDLPAAGTWSVFGRELRVTNLDKVLFPGRPGEAPVTKRDLIRYAAQIAPTVLPYLTRRALNLHRFPGGVGTKGFWHKEVPTHAPEWLPRWDNPAAEPGETRTYLVVDEPAALVWAANFGALEWHAWTSQVDAPQEPTYALIDLDPGGTTSWDDLLVLARLHRTAFEHLQLVARPKVTGRRGIQIWVPIAPRAGIRRHPRLGRGTVQDGRGGRTRSGQLEVAGRRPRRPGPSGLHAERDQQDPGRAVQPAGGRRGAGVGAHRLGRARRPRAATRRVHDPLDRPPSGRARRSVPGRAARPSATARAALGRGAFAATAASADHYDRRWCVEPLQHEM